MYDIYRLGEFKESIDFVSYTSERCFEVPRLKKHTLYSQSSDKISILKRRMCSNVRLSAQTTRGEYRETFQEKL